jgi:sacsin
MMQTGPQNNWRNLLLLLGATVLDRARLIEEALLPEYVGMTPDDQVTALEWLRDNMDAAQTELEAQAPERAEALTSAIQETPLLRSSDGALHAPAEVYMPDADVVRAVLGDTALFPDMAKSYANAQPHWLQFFRKLEMPDSPQIRDLQAYIDARVETAGHAGSEAASERLLAILVHIEKHWAALAGGDADDPEEEFNGFVSHLKTQRWLPALREPRRTKYPAFTPPEARLFAPTELHMPRNGQLVASQCPIAPFQEPEARVRDAFGFPVDPPCSVVMAHFDALRRLQVEVPPDPSDRKGFETALGVIYTYFGRMLPKDGPQQTADEETGDPPPLEGDIAALRKAYAGVECLWDFESARFWPPEHVFATNVRYMGRWRTCILVKNPAADRGYAALGRKQDPSIEDHIEFLDSLAGQFEDAPLPWEAAQNAIQVITRLGHQLEDAQREAEDICLLTRDNRLIHASVVYIADAPWLEGRYDGTKIAVLSASIGGHILKAARIKRLSHCVHEQLSAPPSSSTVGDLLDRCRIWQNRVRSPEFAAAVRRLVQNDDGCLDSDALIWLSEITIVPAAALKTDLYIDTADGPQRVGSGVANYYCDADGNTIYLDASSSYLMQQNLALALNQRLERAHLRDLLPLSSLLENSPAQMNRVLDCLRIRALMATDEKDVPEPPVTETSHIQDFPEEGEVSAPGLDDPGIPAEQAGPVVRDADAAPQAGDAKSRDATDVDAIPSTTAEPDITVAEAGSVVPDQQEEPVEPRVKTTLDPGPTVPHRDGHPSTGGRGRSAGEHHAPPLPRTEPRDTRSRPQPRYAPQHQLISYVDHDKGDDARDEASRDTESATQKRVTGKHAEKAVMQYEVEQRGCTPELMPPGNKGFDIRSVDPSGQVRYIEVKGIDGAWGPRGVSLSCPQFDFVRENPGKDFWVYVVEYARDPERIRIYTIQKPASRVNHYYFDHGWKDLAESARPVKEAPAPGKLLSVDGKLFGQIIEVTEFGVLKKLQVKATDGPMVMMTYKPTNMMVSAPEGE